MTATLVVAAITAALYLGYRVGYMSSHVDHWSKGYVAGRDEATNADDFARGFETGAAFYRACRDAENEVQG